MARLWDMERTCHNCNKKLEGRRRKWCSTRCRNHVSHPALQRAYRNRRPKQVLLQLARQRATRKGLEFSLSVKDIPYAPEFCPIFPWIRLERNKVRSSPNSPALDRIDNLKGYTKSNVRIISCRANSLKSNSEDKELVALGNDASERLKHGELAETKERLGSSGL